MGVFAVILLSQVVLDDTITCGKAAQVLLHHLYLAGLLVDGSSIGTFVFTIDPKFINITLGLAGGPVQRERLAADDGILVETRVTRGFLLGHLTLCPLVEQLSVLTADIAVDRVHLPVEWAAILPGEHLYVFLSGIIRVTVRTFAVAEGTYEVGPLVRSFVTGLSSYSGTVDDFATALIDIPHTVSLTVVLRSGSCSLVQLIPVALLGVTVHEVLTSLQGTLPAGLLEVAVPYQTVLLGLCGAVVIALCIVVERRGIEQQDLGLECHRSSGRPASGVVLGIGVNGVAVVRPAQVGNSLVEQVDHEVSRLLSCSTGNFIRSLQTCKGVVDDGQATIDGVEVEIACCHQTLGLGNHALLLGIGQTGNIIDIVHQQIATTDGFPNKIVCVGNQRVIGITDVG